jgi:formate C-acetyltransferase
LEQVERGMTALDTAIAEMLPSPFASAMVDGTIEKGLDLTRGGAIYNSTGVQLIGFANVVDSLMAVRKAVFEDERLSLEELAECLANDWDDAEGIRSHLLREVPKYGNDEPEVDAVAARVLEHFCDEVLRHRNVRGGSFWPGVFSVGFHVAMGAFSGASADGRRAGEVLGNGITPGSGCATSGPTALLNSVAGLPLGRAHNGTNLNLRFNPRWLRPEALASLMETYFELGGSQVQFNMIDTETLRDAQRNPEAYRDLVVRVSGYSALFTELSELAQEEIISRMEYEA